MPSRRFAAEFGMHKYNVLFMNVLPQNKQTQPEQYRDASEIPHAVSTFRETELKGSDRLHHRSKESKQNGVKGKSGQKESERIKNKQ